MRRRTPGRWLVLAVVLAVGCRSILGIDDGEVYLDGGGPSGDGGAEATTDSPSSSDAFVEGATDSSSDASADGDAPFVLPEGGLKIVFVTSTSLVGRMITDDGGGLEDGGAPASIECNRLAQLAGLPGTYTPWLSTSSSSAVSRLTPDSGPFVLRDGVTIVANDIADLTDGGPHHLIDQTEDGAAPAIPVGFPFLANYCFLPDDAGPYLYVWTGTKRNGKTDGTNCGDWAAETSGLVGVATEADAAALDTVHWTDCSANACDDPLPFYCVQQ